MSSINSNYIDFIEILKRVEYFLFFIIVYNLDEKIPNKQFMKGYLSFVCIIVAFGLIQILWTSTLKISKDNFYAISASFSHKNIYSSVLLLSLPFLYIWKGSKKIKYSLLTLILILLLTLQTRSVLLAFFISSLYYSFNRIDLLKKKFLSLLTIGLVVSILGVFFLHQLGTYDNFVNILDWGNSSTLRSSTILERTFLWKHSFNMFLDHWLIGVGVGNWPVYFPYYGLTLWRLRQGEVIMQRPHNDLFENFNELGIIGGLIFLFILIYPLIKKSNVKNKHIINFGLLSFLVISLFSFPQERIIPSLIFFSLIAFKLKESSTVQVKRSLILFISFFLISSSYLVYGKLHSEIFFKRYITQHNKINSELGINLLANAKSKIFQMDQTSTPIDWYLGELYLKKKEVQKAKSHFNQALLINPYHIHIINSLGGCSIYENDFSKAKDYFERAINIAPYFEDGLYNLAHCSSKLSQQNEAISVLKKIHDKKSDRFTSRIKSYAKLVISNRISLEDNSKKIKALENIFYNDEWVSLIVLKSYENDINFIDQLEYDLEYILKQTHK